MDKRRAIQIMKRAAELYRDNPEDQKVLFLYGTPLTACSIRILFRLLFFCSFKQRFPHKSVAFSLLPKRRDRIGRNT